MKYKPLSYEEILEQLNTPLRSQSCSETFWLMLQAANCEEASREIRNAAIKKHGRVISLHEWAKEAA